MAVVSHARRSEEVGEYTEIVIHRIILLYMYLCMLCVYVCHDCQMVHMYHTYKYARIYTMRMYNVYVFWLKDLAVDLGVAASESRPAK